MKKIIIGILLFFNVGINISNHQTTIKFGSITYAQRQGEIRQVGCTNPQYGGTDPTWWDIFTTWLGEIIDDAIDFLGELYTQEIPGSGSYASGYLNYPWASGGVLPYVDVYYDGYGASCYETPSIYAGPYRGGLMFYCTDGDPEYIDCAFAHHGTNEYGISGRSNEIAYLDECNECVGGSTGLPPCSSPLYYIKLQNGDTRKYYDGDTITVDPSSSAWVKLKLTLYNAHGVTPQAVSWASTSNIFWEWPWDIGNTYDVMINTIGDYTINAYDGGLLAYSTILTNYLHVANRDTVKPTPILCDSLAVVRDSIATNMLNQVASSPELIRTRDSTLSSHETSFSTYDSAGSTRVYPGSFKVGDTLQVPIYARDTITGANHKNINALFHLHQKGVDPFPEPADLFNLLNTRVLLGYTNIYNRYLNHSFLICGDTLIDLAVVIYDTTLALQYVTLNPRDSVIKSDSTGKNPHYSPTFRGQRMINVPRFTISMGKDFKNAEDALLAAHYPEVLAKTYAGIYMMQRYNMGIKTLIKVNGVFKELKIADVTYRRDGTIRTIKVKICQ